MPKWLIIAFFGIGIYLGIMFGLYAILSKFDPYDEKSDWNGDGDANKVIASLWPFTLPFIAVVGIGLWIVFAISKTMDLILKYQRGDSE